MRPLEHLRQAQRLYRHGKPARAIADHILLADEIALADPDAAWAEPILRRAADGAAREGEFERARLLLDRSLQIPGVADLTRVRTLIELGRCEAAGGTSGAALRWEAAEDRLPELPAELRVMALTELGEATYSSGLVGEARRHYDDAYRHATGTFDENPRVDDETMARIIAGLSTTSLITGRRHPRVATMLESITESPPTHPTLPERALMASAAGEVALGVDRPAEGVHRLVDAALGEAPLPAAVMRPAIESLGAALSLTGRPEAAVTLLDERIEQANRDHDLVANVSLLPLRAHACLLSGAIGQALDDARRALALIQLHPSASRLAEAPTRYVLALGSLELDEPAAAERAVTIADHRERWGGTPMHGWFLDGVARVHSHSHRHEAAIRAWTEAGREFTLVGGTGIVCEWRDGLARSLALNGDRREAERIAAEQTALATTFGDARMIAVARGTVAALEPDHRVAADHLGEAMRNFQAPGGELTRCRLGCERGARLRRAGQRRAARDQLMTSLAGATRLGAVQLVRLIGTELAAAGSGAGRIAAVGPLVLTAAERETALLAADGLTNAEIARRRSVSRKTIEAQLSSMYRKLGISGRRHIAEALAASR